ncbi:gamma-glutamylcyclotransferase family protein [Microbacterium sp. E-13]|uniref:gamma-glutamylcyclotransferase family protein n=1 Tax=Microbacterium sp. E-13 TaxID=3404048 RepID=UPI003CF9E565
MPEDSSIQLLFTYSSLRQADLQLDTFGRLLEGEADVLPGYTVDYAEIADPRVDDLSGLSVHPIVRETGNPLDKVVGEAVEVTEDELDAADEFQLALNRRIAVVLASGRSAWVYVAA